MNSKNIKVVDEHNIDRTANVMFAFDLEGSEYVSYWITRDEENNNLFVSKVIKNIDNTFNMLDIDDSDEKARLDGIVKKLVQDSVDSQADKLLSNTLTLSDGKVVKFIAVSFNKEQRINVHKTYITTVKKEVTRVAEKYYAVEVVTPQPSVVEDIFPSVTPVVEPIKEAVAEVPTPAAPVVETPVQPVVSVPETPVSDNFVAFGTESTAPETKVETPTFSAVSPVAEPAKVDVQPEIPVIAAVQPEPTVVEPITVASPVTPVSVQTTVPTEPVVAPIVEQTPAAVIPEPSKVEPTVVTPTPVPASSNVEVGNQPLVFNAAKETNLNAALGEVASASTIPVDNIEPIREFGVDEPVKTVASQPQNVAPVVQPATTDNAGTTVNGGTPPSTQKAGFANSKFFMVVAIAFFLASCVFLGYEVFSYFQLTK